MLSDLQTRKFSHAFHIADMDHDGVLQRADYELYATQMADAFELPHESSASRALHEKIMGDWEMTKQLVAGKDDSITLQEFLTFHDAVIHSPMLDGFVAGYVDGTLALWRAVDPNGPADGATPERFARFLKAFGISAAEAAEAFAHLDRNGNGVMSRDEMIEAQKEFFVSDDANAAGNWLLGKY
jgi:Ca2+-binding EF-hand superfamily protein